MENIVREYGYVERRMKSWMCRMYSERMGIWYVEWKYGYVVCRHGCTAAGGGNTSPTTKLYKFHHLLPTVQIFLHYCMYGMTLKVLKKVIEQDKAIANDQKMWLPSFCNIFKSLIDKSY